MGGSMPAPVLRSELAKIKKATRKPYGVNFIPRVIEKEHIDICIEERVPLVVFYWDEAPPAFISQLKQNNIKVWVQVGSLSEASAAVSAGADAVIVQGSEAGGHNRSTAATFTLLPSVVDLISPIPVIASGGIARPAVRFAEATDLTCIGNGHQVRQALSPSGFNKRPKQADKLALRKPADTPTSRRRVNK